MPFQLSGDDFLIPIKRVYAKSKWLDSPGNPEPWTLIGELNPYTEVRTGPIPIRTILSASPGDSVAELIFEAGYVEHPGATAQLFTPLDQYFDWYIRITSQHPNEAELTQFIGILRADELEAGMSSIVSGTQTLVVMGLEDVLAKAELFKTKIKTTGGPDPGKTEYTINTIPAFNVDLPTDQFRVKGNRTANKLSDGEYGFSETDNERWTAHQALKRLIKDHKPGGINWVLDGEDELSVILDEVIKITPGMSLRDALDRICNETRGLRWSLPDWPRDGETQNGDVTIKVHSILKDSITTANGTTIPGNPNPGPFNLQVPFPHDKLPEAIPIPKSTMDRYETLIVQGQPALIACTLDKEIGLTNGWTAAEQAEYIAGITIAPGPGGNPAESEDLFRKTEHFRRVFQRFIIDPTWDWKPSNGFKSVAGGPSGIALKQDPDQSTNALLEMYPDNTEENGVYLHDKRFETMLPMFEEVDYSTSEYGDYVAVNTINDSRAVRLPMMVMYPVDRLQDGDSQNTAVRVEALSVGVSIAADGLAIELDAPIPHYLAKGTFSEPTEIEPQLDFRDLLATVAFRIDERQKYTVDLTKAKHSDPDEERLFQPHENQRTKVITLRDAEFWWAAPGTIYDIKLNGAPKYIKSHTDNGVDVGLIIRSDFYQLETIGEMARHLYQTVRRPTNFVIKDIAPLFGVLDFVTTQNIAGYPEPVNAVCTARVIDWENFTTTIETQSANVDVILDAVLDL